MIEPDLSGEAPPDGNGKKIFNLSLLLYPY